MRRPASLVETALVVQPWVAAQLAPWQPAGLKSFLAARGFQADAHYLNLLMEAMVGRLQTRMALRTASWRAWAEWPFARWLFGPRGLNELSSDPLSSPSEEFRDFLSHAGVSPRRMRRLAQEDAPRFLEQCLRRVPWERYDLICFSDIFNSHAACLALARLIKDRWREKIIVFFGPNVEGEIGLETLRGCEWIDFVVDGDPEETISSLIDEIQRGGAFPARRIPGLVRRGEESADADRAARPLTDMNALETPDHGDYYRWLGKTSLVSSVSPIVMFEASRGCWWGEKQHCRFCGLNGDDIAFRQRSPQKVLADIQTLTEKHRPAYLHAADSILSRQHLGQLVPALQQARARTRLPWRLFWEVKPLLSQDHVRLLAEAGISSVQAGIESLSTPALKALGKGGSAILNLQALKFFRLYKIRVYWNMLYGFPGATARDHALTAARALLISHLTPPYVVIPVRAARFSPYYLDWSRYAKRPPVPQQAYRHCYPRPRFDLDKISHYFDIPAPEDPALEKSEAALRVSVAFWQNIHRLSCLAYDGRSREMRVYDSRPRRLGQLPEERVHRLSEAESLVMRQTERVQSAAAVLASLRKAFPLQSRPQLLCALSRLEREGLIFRESGFLLNLALPLGAIPRRQRRSCAIRLAAALREDLL